jgi:hypothetical protein
MEHIAFSDTLALTSDSTTTTETGVLTLFSLEEYCKKHPEALECREYDV